MAKAKKTAKKKVAVKAKKKVSTKGKKPAKKKQSAKKQSVKRKKQLSNAPTPRSPNICASNFSANNGDPVTFTALPTPTVTVSQKSLTDIFPFSPVTGSSNGLSYTVVTSQDTLTVSVPAINQTYSYKVSCSCPGDEGSHSVTVGS